MAKRVQGAAQHHCSASCPALCRASTSFFAVAFAIKAWMAGTSPAMTNPSTPSARAALEVIAQALGLIALLAHEAKHREEVVGAEIAGRARDLARFRRQRLQFRRVLAEELEGRRELHAVFLRQRLLGQFLAVEIGDRLEPDDVELLNDEIGPDVVGDVGPSEIGKMRLLAIGTALELPHHHETLALLAGLGKI